MGLFKQVFVLAKKDLLLVGYHNFVSTVVRALLFPVIFGVILSYIRIFEQGSSVFGIGTPTDILSFNEALAQTGERPRIVLIDNGLTGDVDTVIDSLSTTISRSGKELYRVNDASSLTQICPSTNKGVSQCYGAVEFKNSPSNGSSWEYTFYMDDVLMRGVNVNSDTNPPQLYGFPFQRAIVEAILQTTNSSVDTIQALQQYPVTSLTEAQREKQERENYLEHVEYFLAFTFFIGMCGIAYHCVAHIVYQREKGLLALIDAMMPNRHRWQCIVVRTISVHAAFDLIYLPGWIIMGVVVAVIAFPSTGVGILVGIHIVAGLALTSYCILVSSLFRRAQLAAISSIVAALCFALVAQFATATNPASAAVTMYATAALFPPSGYVYFIRGVASYAASGFSYSFASLNPDPTSVQITGAAVMGFLAMQIILYPIIGAFIERYLHGTSSKARHLMNTSDMNGVAVKLEGFSKYYTSRVNKKQTVKAVDDLSLSFHTGAINVLLGSNGSGKTTTLSAIAGLETISSGSISVDASGGLGVAPQKNIMWDDMTVREHITFFENLKSTSKASHDSHKQEVTRIIGGCDLDNKAGEKSKTLSGGQKRKLQLAMAFAGGSRVCLVDEASSGIDPLARRKVWDVLLKERGTRTILLTTHFLDEADALADHVAVMSRGTLKAEGSAAGLKRRYGDGYSVALPHGSSSLTRLPQGVSHAQDYDQHILRMQDASSLSAVVIQLELEGINEFLISGPTMEQVFLKLVGAMDDDKSIAKELESGLDRDARAILSEPLHLNTGKGCGPLKQVGILFMKRLTVLKHNYMPYVCAVFVALTCAGLVTRFFRSRDVLYPNGIPCVDPEAADPSTYGYYSYATTLYPSGLQYSAVFGPADRVTTQDIRRLVPDPYNYTTPEDYKLIPIVNTTEAFMRYVLNEVDTDSFVFDGGFFLRTGEPSLLPWQAAWDYRDAVLYQTLAYSVMSNVTLQSSITQFSSAFAPSNGIVALVAVFTTLGFAIYPGLFSLYPTAERLRKVRAMQYSNGVHSTSLWPAYLLFDGMFILLISVLTMAIWASTWSGWYELGYLFPVLLLFGLAATTFSYIVSLFVTSVPAAFAFTAVLQVVISMLVLVGYVTAAANATATEVYHWFDYIQYTVGLICPVSWLMRAMFMALNQYSLVCRGPVRSSNPGELSIYGAPILYLALQFVVFSAFLIWWESGKSLEAFGIRLRKKTKQDDLPDVEMSEIHINGKSADAIEEPSRLQIANDGLQVYNISKSFGRNLAVDAVSFGVLPSERFALLGPNGAGKSTMISLIQGDLKPSHRAGSSIVIDGDSLFRAPVAAKNHLGVCPQFDSVDSMTLREHLHFYARARGVPDKNFNVDQLITRLGLEEHKNKLCKKLSGGTLRKLSLAIALIANPSVLLLDEPSSGMDAAAKRALWGILSDISKNRALLITTHSMEEADALCDRAGIMAGRVLALGSVKDLRARHGNEVTLHLVHHQAPHTSTQDTDIMRQWVLRTFPGARVETRTFGGQLRFTVPKRNADGHDADIGNMFHTIEEAKGDLGVSEYSICPSTLDQIFMNVVTKHNVEEENAGSKSRKGWKSWIGL